MSFDDGNLKVWNIGLETPALDIALGSKELDAGTGSDLMLQKIYILTLDVLFLTVFFFEKYCS
jgi:hypothetical protein